MRYVIFGVLEDHMLLFQILTKVGHEISGQFMVQGTHFTSSLNTRQVARPYFVSLVQGGRPVCIDNLVSNSHRCQYMSKGFIVSEIYDRWQHKLLLNIIDCKYFVYILLQLISTINKLNKECCINKASSDV